MCETANVKRFTEEVKKVKATPSIKYVVADGIPFHFAKDDWECQWTPVTCTLEDAQMYDEYKDAKWASQNSRLNEWGVNQIYEVTIQTTFVLMR